LLVMGTGLLLALALAVSGCGQSTPTPVGSASGSLLHAGNMVAAQSTNTGADTQPRSISVNGTGTASAAPDMATIQLGVDTTDASAQVAAQENATKMNNVVSAVKALGIPDKDIQTAAYNIYIDRIYENGNPTNEYQYHVTNQIVITVRDLSLVGKLLESAITTDVNNVGGITFGLSDPDALTRQARDKAMTDAIERAKQLASGLGVELGAPLQISEYSSGGVTPYRASVGMVEKAAGVNAAPPISGGELDVNVQVSVSFAIQ
jgi:uncharacterized protein YggE